MASWSIQKFGHNKHGQKTRWGLCPFILGGSCVPIEHEVAWAEAYLHTKWHLDTSSPLARIDTGQKWGAAVPLLGEMGPHLPQCGCVKGTLIHPAVWPQYMRRKVGGATLSLYGGAGSLSNTMSPGLRPASIPSSILIHPAVWPQRTWAENWRRVPPFWEASWVPI